MNMPVAELKEMKSYLDERWNDPHASDIERTNLLPNLIWAAKKINEHYARNVCPWCERNFEKVFKDQVFVQ